MSGQDRFEEIDYLTVAAANGANFGWNDFEGFAPFAGRTLLPRIDGEAIKAYAVRGRCSVIGGYVVRTSACPRCSTATCTGTSARQGRSLIPDPGGARRDKATGFGSVI